jgi:hypothetical protein
MLPLRGQTPIFGSCSQLVLVLQSTLASEKTENPSGPAVRGWNPNRPRPGAADRINGTGARLPDRDERT